jgi:predicted RNA-binding Zn ribbon-like protein
VPTPQAPAPGQLIHVQQFVNTLDVESGRDGIGEPTALREWFLKHELGAGDLQVTDADVAATAEVREALRAVLLANQDDSGPPPSTVDALNRAAARARFIIRFGAHGGRAALEPTAPGVDGAIGRLLAICQEAMAQGRWSRLRACRSDTCQWAFYDHSKNQSKQWCSMDVCGNRAKARKYRQHRAEPPVRPEHEEETR